MTHRHRQTDRRTRALTHTHTKEHTHTDVDGFDEGHVRLGSLVQRLPIISQLSYYYYHYHNHYDPVKFPTRDLRHAAANNENICSLFEILSVHVHNIIRYARLGFFACRIPMSARYSPADSDIRHTYDICYEHTQCVCPHIKRHKSNQERLAARPVFACLIKQKGYPE